MKKAKKYIIITVIILASATLLAGLYANRHHFKTQHNTKDQTQSPKPNQEQILLNLQKKIEENSQIIKNISTQNQQKVLPRPENEHYARLLLAILTIKSQLQQETKFNIKFSLETIYTFAKTDPFILKAFNQIEIQEIYGIQYFKNNFSKLVKDINTLEEPNGGIFCKFIHKWLSPHFTYISKNSSKNGNILHKARIYLSQGKLTEFYEEISKIKTESPFLKEYHNELIQFIQIWQATNTTEKYIENVVFTQI